MSILKTNPERTSKLKVLSTGDPGTAFKSESPEQILARLGPPRSLLSSSSKVEKGRSLGVLTRAMYLTPGVLCPASTRACRASCLGHTSGRMPLPASTKARDKRAALYFCDQDWFFSMLRSELWQLQAEAKAMGCKAACRLNGTSDIPWETLHPELMEEFPAIQFYDYTKLRGRVNDFTTGKTAGRVWPANYHLTYSGEANGKDASVELLRRGANVAVVFWPELPDFWWGFPVIDGDLNDARFLDPSPVIVGLRAKGVAQAESDGFVARPNIAASCYSPY